MNAIQLYLLKIRGTARIPDYIQIRDRDFSLIGYYRPGRIKKLAKYTEHTEKILQNIEQQLERIPFGEVTPVRVIID